MHENLKELKKLLEPLSNRIGALLGLGRLSRIDPGIEQFCQIEMLEDEVRDKVPHHMPYGYSYVPQEGSEPLVAFLRGDKSGGLVIQIRDTRYQKTLEKGEVALHDDQDQIIHIQRDGILIKTDKEVTIDAPKTKITGDVQIDGECEISGIKFTQHTHPESIGSNTGKPE